MFPLNGTLWLNPIFSPYCRSNAMFDSNLFFDIDGLVEQYEVGNKVVWYGPKFRNSGGLSVIDLLEHFL
jgi:hypothetical protein